MPNGARPFTGVTLDRAASVRQDPASVRQLRERTDARAVVAGSEGVLIDGTSLHRVGLGSVPESEPVLLGLDRGVPLFAVDLDSVPPPEPARLIDRGQLVALRDAATLLSHAEAGLAAYLTALLNWHRRHHFCANCGARTVVQEAGYSRRCPRCHAVHFPRTDPVVIMTVEHDGRLLLGRRAGWPPDRLSVLAGFISPGESAEEAVVREVREESGIIVRDPVYVASQPWPFPSSLMLGFHAKSDGGAPVAQDGELEEVRWASAEELWEAILERGGSGLQLPPQVSIARYLIDRWIERRGTQAPASLS